MKRWQALLLKHINVTQKWCWTADNRLHGSHGHSQENSYSAQRHSGSNKPNALNKLNAHVYTWNLKNYNRLSTDVKTYGRVGVTTFSEGFSFSVFWWIFMHHFAHFQLVCMVCVEREAPLLSLNNLVSYCSCWANTHIHASLCGPLSCLLRSWCERQSVKSQFSSV